MKNVSYIRRASYETLARLVVRQQVELAEVDVRLASALCDAGVSGDDADVEAAEKEKP